MLSPDTERTDTREKLLACRLPPSRREYLLLRQDRIQADLYSKDTASGTWQHQRLDSGHLQLQCLQAELVLADVYADVVFADDVG